MIIDSQFFITNYTGKLPLSLMSMPSGFLPDPVKVSEYNRFIQNIDTIYATQNIDGEIPKFWTRRTQTVNEMGNIAYTYEPHPESTLTSLSSLSSYYFILRDNSSVPVKIPVNGGETIGFNDISSLPIVNSITSNVPQPSGAIDDRRISISGNNAVDILFNLTNLRPLDSYYYNIESVGGNWPVNITAESGVLKPARVTGSVTTNLLFCPSTGLCGSNILPYTVTEDCLLKNPDLLYTTLRMSIIPEANTGIQVYSDHYTIICDNCLPSKPVAEVLNPTTLTPQNSTTVNEDNFDGLAYHDFVLRFSELQILEDNDKNYSYSVETIGAEWPIIYVTPTGGVATIKRGQRTVNVSGRFFFCPTTGLCPPGSPNVPPYSIPSYPKFLSGEDSLSDVSTIKIRAALESYDCPGEKVYSNTSIISFIR